jgi:hypothetical protein
MNVRSFVFLLLATTLAACGTIQPNATVGVSADDLSDFASYEADIDGNGVVDIGNQSFVAGPLDGNAALLIEPGPKLPNGTAAGQSLESKGFGSGLYSDTENGWIDGWFTFTDVSVDGEFTWIGIGGIRPGAYEMTCASPDAELYSLDGWCLPEMGMKAGDDRRYLIHVTDGTADCPRQSYHFGFEVWEDGTVTPLNGRISPVDETCP